MRPIGQENVVATGKLALQNSSNILLCGPSGFGKSHIAKYLALKTGMVQYFCYAAPPDLRKNWLLDHYRVVLIVDEIHGSKAQLDWVLFLDRYSGRVVFTTTNPELLLEPLRNRCMRLDLSPYTEEELLKIGGPGCTNFLVLISRGVPRTVKQFTRVFHKKSEPEIINLLGLDFDGKDYLFPTEVEYLRVLNSLGGTASKTTLGSILKMDLTEVEAGLLFLGKINITSRGRSINEQT